MKVLMIGQLPKEVGGSYTTGVCNVVYELSKCSAKDTKLFIYATNLYSKIDKSASGTIYYETKMRYLNVIWNIVRRPLSSFKQWLYYKNVTHMSPIRCEFYKDNFERVIRDVQPDIIHCMNIIQMAPLYYANQKYKKPILLTIHGVFFDNDKSVEDLSKGNVLLADYTTGLTPETMKGITEVLHYPKEQSFMVPNGADTKKFYYSESAREQLRRELGVDDDVKIFVTVGSLQHRKGQLSFCKVLSSFPQEFKYKYIIIGSGVDKESIEQFVAENGMTEKVQIVGYVSNMELYKYYSAADVYIHGSYEEGQALSEVEAYATGLRVAVNKDIIGTVVTDTSYKEEYYIFDYNDFNIMSFIQWVTSSNKDRRSKSQYDWREIFDKYIEVYNRILEN